MMDKIVIKTMDHIAINKQELIVHMIAPIQNINMELIVHHSIILPVIKIMAHYVIILKAMLSVSSIILFQIVLPKMELIVLIFNKNFVLLLMDIIALRINLKIILELIAGLMMEMFVLIMVSSHAIFLMGLIAI